MVLRRHGRARDPKGKAPTLRPRPKRRMSRQPQRRSRLTDLSRIVPEPLFAEAASLIGDPTRAAMLGHLMDGRARTAKELAGLAGVSAATASGHIAKMTAAGLVAVAAQGRHRYVRLAGPDVAEVLEKLMALAAFARPQPRRARTTEDEAFRLARSCYDHLAGKLAVELVEALVRRGVLARGLDGFAPTLSGERWFRTLGVDVARARCSTRSFARCCLDWSERRDHLAGALGASLLEALIARGHLAPQGRPHARRHADRPAVLRRGGFCLSPRSRPRPRSGRREAARLERRSARRRAPRAPRPPPSRSRDARRRGAAPWPSPRPLAPRSQRQ